MSGGDTMGDDDDMIREADMILTGDVPDPDRRLRLASMIVAEIRTRTVHTLREAFDPYIGMDGEPPSPDVAMRVMREAIIHAAGYSTAPALSGERLSRPGP
jgi:hypothetical protein